LFEIGLIESGVSKLRLAKPFHPPAKPFSQWRKIYNYEKFVDLVQYSTSQNNHIA